MSSRIEEFGLFARAMFEAAEDSFWAVDDSKRLVFFNPIFAHLMETEFGLRLSIGLALVEATRAQFPRLATRWDQLYDRALRGEQTTDEQEYEVRGEPRSYLVSLYPVVANGKAIGVSCLSKDVTQLKAAERELRVSTERFRRVFHASHAPILVSTVDEGRILDANDAFARMVGYPREDLLGRTTAELHLWEDPGARTAAMEQLRRLGRTETLEVNFRRRDGSIGVALGAFVETWFDSIHAMISVSEDITERLRWQQRRAQASKLEAIGQLAGGVAHDFNNLLTVILGADELLMSGKLSAKGQRHAEERIHDAAARAAQLTKQLLAFGRKQPLHPEPLDPNEEIRNVAGMLQRTLGEEVRIVFDLGRARRIRVDRTQLTQVLIDLALNARDAMPDGGRISFQTRSFSAGDERLKDVPLDRAMMLEIRDTGVGMDHEVQSHLFEPFFTTKRQGEGTGLGLSTVYGIVRQSGGYIRVESAPGRGTSFRLYFPEFEPAPLPEPHVRLHH